MCITDLVHMVNWLKIHVFPVQSGRTIIFKYNFVGICLSLSENMADVETGISFGNTYLLSKGGSMTVWAVHKIEGVRLFDN